MKSPAMTVKQLIEALQSLPSDMPIYQKDETDECGSQVKPLTTLMVEAIKVRESVVRCSHDQSGIYISAILKSVSYRTVERTFKKGQKLAVIL
jgi:hypothetical protein